MKVVVLILTVWNINTGKALDTITVNDAHLPTYAIEGKVDRIERCRIEGVRVAKLANKHWADLGYDNVSSNVDCHWETLPGSPL